MSHFPCGFGPVFGGELKQAEHLVSPPPPSVSLRNRWVWGHPTEAQRGQAAGPEPNSKERNKSPDPPRPADILAPREALRGAMGCGETGEE